MGNNLHCHSRTTTIEQAACGKVECTPDERKRGTNLGLYSVTFNNDATLDRATLRSVSFVSSRSRGQGFRHFLEIFAPNACVGQKPSDVGMFLNHHIVRLLAGVTRRSRPIFLKMPYFGAKSLEALVHSIFDCGRNLGRCGLAQHTMHFTYGGNPKNTAHGPRYLAGKSTNRHQLTFVRYLRALADGKINPPEAVREYHDKLKQLNIKPNRSLNDDLELTVKYS